MGGSPAGPRAGRYGKPIKKQNPHEMRVQEGFKTIRRANFLPRTYEGDFASTGFNSTATKTCSQDHP
jgi:hypothetical protein